MAKGRKRKTGPRTKSGALSRAGQSRVDRGTERIQAMRDKFGDHYNSAIGRAFASGLLGNGPEALDRYQEGKRFARVYTKLIARSYRCPLNDTPRGGAIEIDHEREQLEQDWLFTAMDKLDREGLRPWLDQLVSPIYTDAGPYWLEAILKGGKHPADLMLLKTAIKALDAITPQRKPMGILVAA